MRLLYSILFYLALPFVCLRLLWRSRRDPNYAKRWSERFGRIPAHIPSHCIWWHCVSVGETLAAVPLIKALIKRHPGMPVLVTGMTPSGSVQIQKQLGDVVSHMYAPYDLPLLWNKFLKTVQPKILIIMETELWPNMLAACHAHNVPTILINARLSEKSAKGYARFGAFTRSMLDNLNSVAVQNQQDGDRFLKLGLAQEKLHVTGTVKFDITVDPALIRKASELRQRWDTKETKRPVFIAASTHPGEEEIIVAAFKKLLSQDPDMLLILVPRHPERIKDVMELCEKNNLRFCRRSQEELPTAETNVFLGDTMGELLLFYAMADMAFVGGSLIVRGGHNVLEPAALGLPVITGPSLYNFAQIDHLLTSAEALIKVKDSETLYRAVLGLLNDHRKREAVGKRGEAVIAKNRGASEKQLNLIDNVLNPNRIKKALILVDLQNDFMPGGSLGVVGGDEVVPIANQLQEKFDIVIASKDWHPENHISFVNLWPSHCVQDTFGSEFVKGLNTQKIQKVVHKGTQVEIDSYSAFFDNAHAHKTDLDDYLKTLGVTDVYLMGLTTNYCIKYSVMDARHLGYNVYVIEDGCRGIGDTTEAWEEIRKAGAVVVSSGVILTERSEEGPPSTK